MFESYSYDFVFEFDAHEENALNVLEELDELAYLKGRVDAVITERKTAQHGRLIRRLGGIPNIVGNAIKVETLSDGLFHKITRSLKPIPNHLKNRLAKECR